MLSSDICVYSLLRTDKIAAHLLVLLVDIMTTPYRASQSTHISLPHYNKHLHTVLVLAIPPHTSDR